VSDPARPGSAPGVELEPEIVVVGSINVDLSLEVERFPDPGETVLGRSLARGGGGKGANQAVAAARLGRRVALVGRVGDDADGAAMRADLEAEVLARHDHVEAVVCGHFHRAIHRRFGGTVASCWPSTAAQLSLELVAGSPAYTDEPAAVGLHRFEPGAGLSSHLVPVVAAERWTPAWGEAIGEAATDPV